jgi:glycosyltransferase involved in cell wall biosynthesis
MESDLDNPAGRVLGESPTVWHVGGDDVRLRIPLLLELRKRGFGVAAVGSESGAIFAKSNIPYFRYSLDRWINPVADMCSVSQLRQLLLKHRPDIVHGFDTKPAIMAPIAARHVGIHGKVCTVTGLGYIFSSNTPLALALRPVYRYLQRHASDAAQVTVFQNPDDQAYFRSRRIVREGRDALVLSSGVDIEGLLSVLHDQEALRYKRTELGLDGRLVVTMVARLVQHKGVREYLRAAAVIKQQRTDVAFILVGPSASEGRQAVSLRELGQYGGFVQYLGLRRDVPSLLALSDLFVLPSYYPEGVPRVLLEAGALGLPVVTTDMPGCREAVRDGWNGLLVPPRDVAALARAVTQILSSSEQREAMGMRSRIHIAERFSLAHVADAYEEIYRRVLQMEVDEYHPVNL